MTRAYLDHLPAINGSLHEPLCRLNLHTADTTMTLSANRSGPNLYSTSQRQTYAQLWDVQTKHLWTETGNDHIPAFERTVHVL